MSFMMGLVEQKIAHDRSICGAVSRDNISGDSDRKNIRQFFPDLFSDGEFDTTNLPQGCKLSHYLIVGSVPVVDLRADDTAKSFRDKHGLRIEDAEYLAERKLLIPNLYERNANNWKTSDPSLAGLVAKSYVVGERVDTLLGAKYKYEEHVRNMKDLLSERFRDQEILDNNQSDMVERVVDEDDFEILSKRYGYLKIYEPDSARRIKKLFEQGKYHEASRQTRIQKWTACTDITGAIGGRFVYGPWNLEHVYDSGHLDREDSEFIRRFLGDRMEVLEYLFGAITGGNRVDYRGDLDSATLCRFLSQPQVARIKRELAILSDELFEDAVKGGIDDPKVDDFMRLQREYEDRLAKAASIGKRGKGIAAVGVEAASLLTGHAIQAALGFAGVLLNSFGIIQEKPGERIGKWAASRRGDAVRSRVIGLTTV